MKLTVLRNIGKKDAHLVGDYDLADFREGAEVDVNDKTAQKLLDRKLAEPASKTLRAVPAQSDVVTHPADYTVEAIKEEIAKTDDRNKLRSLLKDERKGVKKAAQKRLEELK